MTQAEIDQLPSYSEAKAASYNLPLGKYRTRSASTHEAALIEVVDDPQSKYNREIFNRVTIVRDALPLTPLDEEFHFQKY